MSDTEKDEIRAEYERVFGLYGLTAADRCKLSARKMREELDNWYTLKQRRDDIKAS